MHTLQLASRFLTAVALTAFLGSLTGCNGPQKTRLCHCGRQFRPSCDFTKAEESMAVKKYAANQGEFAVAQKQSSTRSASQSVQHVSFQEDEKDDLGKSLDEILQGNIEDKTDDLIPGQPLYQEPYPQPKKPKVELEEPQDDLNAPAKLEPQSDLPRADTSNAVQQPQSVKSNDDYETPSPAYEQMPEPANAMSKGATDGAHSNGAIVERYEYPDESYSADETYNSFDTYDGDGMEIEPVPTAADMYHGSCSGGCSGNYAGCSGSCTSCTQSCEPSCGGF